MNYSLLSSLILSLITYLSYMLQSHWPAVSLVPNDLLFTKEIHHFFLCASNSLPQSLPISDSFLSLGLSLSGTFLHSISLTTLPKSEPLYLIFNCVFSDFPKMLIPYVKNSFLFSHNGWSICTLHIIDNQPVPRKNINKQINYERRRVCLILFIIKFLAPIPNLQISEMQSNVRERDREDVKLKSLSHKEKKSHFQRLHSLVMTLQLEKTPMQIQSCKSHLAQENV